MNELKPCPFCGNDVNDDEGCFQVAGFRPPSTPAFSVRCGNPSCNADVTAPSREAAITAWNTRAASGGDSARLDQRARGREFLAQQYDRAGLNDDAAYIRNGGNGNRTTGDTHIRMALRAITAALASQQGAAHGDAPEGWVLVPARMELTPENMEALTFMLGGDPDAGDADERWNGGTLWVGETTGDNGEKYYGLNVANVECYEEGSLPIVKFDNPPTQPAGDVGREGVK